MRLLRSGEIDEKIIFHKAFGHLDEVSFFIDIKAVAIEDELIVDAHLVAKHNRAMERFRHRLKNRKANIGPFKIVGGTGEIEKKVGFFSL